MCITIGLLKTNYKEKFLEAAVDQRKTKMRNTTDILSEIIKVRQQDSFKVLKNKSKFLLNPEFYIQ